MCIFTKLLPLRTNQPEQLNHQPNHDGRSSTLKIPSTLTIHPPNRLTFKLYKNLLLFKKCPLHFLFLNLYIFFLSWTLVGVLNFFFLNTPLSKFYNKVEGCPNLPASFIGPPKEMDHLVRNPVSTSGPQEMAQREDAYRVLRPRPCKGSDASTKMTTTM